MASGIISHQASRPRGAECSISPKRKRKGGNSMATIVIKESALPGHSQRTHRQNGHCPQDGPCSHPQKVGLQLTTEALHGEQGKLSWTGASLFSYLHIIVGECRRIHTHDAVFNKKHNCPSLESPQSSQRPHQTFSAPSSPSAFISKPSGNYGRFSKRAHSSPRH